MIRSGNDLYIKINGIEISYDDLGKGDQPVIFIHGFPFDRTSWRSQVEHLKGSHRVITYDIRGFGKTKADDATFSMDLFADDLVQLMDKLEIKKAIVCGLSMGGYILLNAVDRYPERFLSIVLSDTQCNSDSAEGKEKRFKAIEQIENGGLKDYAEGFVNNIFCKETLANRKELTNGIKEKVLSTQVSTFSQTLNALAQRKDTCPTLSKINIPVMVLCGKEDVITPVEKAEFLFKNIKGAEIHIIEHAGHMSNMEQPEEFNRHLSDFIVK